jgi:hypothetical protein
VIQTDSIYTRTFDQLRSLIYQRRGISLAEGLDGVRPSVYTKAVF